MKLIIDKGKRWPTVVAVGLILGGAVALGTDLFEPAERTTTAALATLHGPATANSPQHLERKESIPAQLGDGPATPRQKTKSQLFDSLAESNDPRDAFAAYQLAQRCLFSRQFEARALSDSKFAAARHWTPPAETCGDLSPGQLTSRMRPLNLAADAGVPGAAKAVAMEGPDGAGWNTEHDAALLAMWNERVQAQIEAGVRNGDSWSIDTAFHWYRSDGIAPDPFKALAYQSALQELNIQRHVAVDAQAVASLQNAKGALTPEQLAEVTSQASQLVEQAKASPYWSMQ